MAIYHQIFVSIVFVLLAQRHDVNAAVKSYKTSHNYPEKQVIYDSYSFKEGIVAYAVCDRSAQEKNCTIMQEMYPDRKPQRSCTVSLNVYQENANITDKIYVTAFGRENVILFWEEIGPAIFFKLVTVNMDNCGEGGFVLPDASKRIYDQLRYDDKIVTYDDTFDIFIKNGNLTDSNDMESLMTVNSRGFVDKPPVDIFKSGDFTVRHISPIDVNSSSKSYVYSKELADQYVLAILEADGSERVVATHDNKFNFYTSMVNDLITLCAREGLRTIMTCTQYDKEGNIKFNVTFDDANFKEKVAPRDLYNLPGGGFFIVLSEYAKSGDEVDYDAVTDYIVIKVDEEGKKVGSIHLNELVEADNMIKSMIDVHVWKNGDEEFCAAVAGQGVNQTNHEDEPRDIKIDVNCFTEADLTA